MQIAGCALLPACARSWSWPCLLRQADLTDLGWASSWNRQSFRTLHSNQHGGSSKSMLFSDSMRQLIQQHQQQEAAEQQQQQQGASLQPAEQLHMPGRQQQQAAGRGSPLHLNRQAKISNRQRLVEQTFKQLFKDDLHAVIPIRNFQAVDELLRQWNVDLQAYMQGRALLQLRLERAARSAAAAASAAGGGGCCISTSMRSSSASGDLHIQRQQQEQQRSSTADLEAGRLPQAALASSNSGSSIPQRRPAAAQALRVRTSSVSEGGSSCEPRSAASLSAAGGSNAVAADTPASAAADIAAGEPCCRTPRLAPLKPRPVLPDEISKGLKPRLVSKDEEEGSTAMGRCCAGLAGALFGGPGAEEEEGAALDDVGCVAERLEVQRQALVDLEASILEAQKEVCWLACSGC